MRRDRGKGSLLVETFIGIEITHQVGREYFMVKIRNETKRVEQWENDYCLVSTLMIFCWFAKNLI